jgi:hypothetical protein
MKLSFELYNDIKCDMLKFLKVSKVVSTFLKTLQNLLVVDIVRK